MVGITPAAEAALAYIGRHTANAQIASMTLDGQSSNKRFTTSPALIQGILVEYTHDHTPMVCTVNSSGLTWTFTVVQRREQVWLIDAIQL